MKGQIGSVIIKADRAQFAQMIITAENRTLKLNDALRHPLGPCPWALESADAGIAEENQQIITCQGASQNMTAADMIPQPCGRIFDGMVMVQKIRGDQKTFAQLANSMMSMVLHEGTNSQRIDVVFDVYRNNSIKNHKREKRGSESGHKVRNFKTDKIHQWRTFLSNSKNKSLLSKCISEKWQNERYRERFAGNTIFVTTENYCYELSSIGVTAREELRSTLEEEGTRVFLHAAHTEL